MSQIFDATYTEISTPSTSVPRYLVSPDASCVPNNDLAHLKQLWSEFVVVGAGRAGIDAVLYLLGLGCDPSLIVWVVSQEAWLINREQFFPDRFISSFMAQLRELEDAGSVTDVMLRLESIAFIMRRDTTTVPMAFRCATVSLGELQQLRRITRVVRSGQVVEVSSGEVRLEQGPLTITPKNIGR